MLYKSVIIIILLLSFDFWDRSAGRVTFHNLLFSLSHSLSINFKDELSHSHSLYPFLSFIKYVAPLVYDCNPHPQYNVFHHKNRVCVCERKYHCPFIYTHIIDHTHRLVITFHLLLYVCMHFNCICHTKQNPSIIK